MPYPEILHHGASQGLIASCYQSLMGAKYSLQIDCGLYRGAETSAEGGRSWLSGRRLSAGQRQCSAHSQYYLKAMQGDRRYNDSSSATKPWRCQDVLSRNMACGAATSIWMASASRPGRHEHARWLHSNVDRQELVSFIARMREWLDDMHLVHGEVEVKRALAPKCSGAMSKDRRG